MPVAEKKKTTAERLLEGDRNAVARLISWAENGDPRFPKALRRIYPEVGRARRWGLTGPPGVGKSTLVNELILRLREQERTVGVLAVDPSSPLTGGALLGDRIRMEGRPADAGVFIRSMASRKSHGGLARAAVDACDVMDASGFDDLLIETVGVGQAAYDVVSAADTVVVVMCPGAGDSIQAMKSGLLELADVIVVNKNDALGADRLAMDLEEAVHIRLAGRGKWMTPVVRCSAGKRQGIEDVLEAVESHQQHLAGERLEARRKAMRAGQVRYRVAELLDEALWGTDGYDRRASALLEEGRTPYDIAETLRDEILEHGVLNDGASPEPSPSAEGMKQ